MQVIANDNLTRKLGPHCVRLLLCFLDPERMVKGNSTDDLLFKLFSPFSCDHEGGWAYSLVCDYSVTIL